MQGEEEEEGAEGGEVEHQDEGLEGEGTSQDAAGEEEGISLEWDDAHLALNLCLSVTDSGTLCQAWGV
jgi:hypothetical protein